MRRVAAFDRSNFNPRSKWALAAALLLLPTLAACGKSDGPRVPVFPVTGKVTFNGAPAYGAQVVLHPTGAEATSGVSAQGIVDKDGNVKISSYGDGDGAPAGDYAVTVLWFKVLEDPNGGGARGPNVIPKQYSDPTTSPVKVTVSGSPTQLPPIEIKGDGKKKV